MTQQQASTSVRDRVTAQEWQERVALAAAYRLVAHFHWDDLIFTISPPGSRAAMTIS
jgi:hypothetical protein